MENKELTCSFCGKKKDDTNLLIAGLDAHICDRCIEQANGIIHEESTHKVVEANREDISLGNPKQIKAFLDDCGSVANEWSDASVLSVSDASFLGGATPKVYLF